MAPEPQPPILRQRPPPLPPVSPPRRSGWPYVGLAVLTLLVWTPLLGVFASSEIASALGCRLNEGGVSPCLVLGRDIGDLLYTLFVLGWLMLVTAPFMLITALLWVALAVRWLWRRLRTAR